MPKTKSKSYSYWFKLKKDIENKGIDKVINEFGKEISKTSKSIVDALPGNKEFKDLLTNICDLGKPSTSSPKFTEQDKDFLNLIYHLNQIYQKTYDYFKKN